jgi:hypothetical protein
MSSTANSIDLHLVDGEAPKLILNGEDVTARISAADFVLQWDVASRTFYLTVTYPVVVK